MPPIQLVFRAALWLSIFLFLHFIDLPAFNPETQTAMKWIIAWMLLIWIFFSLGEWFLSSGTPSTKQSQKSERDGK